MSVRHTLSTIAAMLIFVSSVVGAMTALSYGEMTPKVAVLFVVSLAPLVWVMVDTALEIALEVFWPESNL